VSACSSLLKTAEYSTIQLILCARSPIDVLQKCFMKLGYNLVYKMDIWIYFFSKRQMLRFVTETLLLVRDHFCTSLIFLSSE